MDPGPEHRAAASPRLIERAKVALRHTCDQDSWRFAVWSPRLVRWHFVAPASFVGKRIFAHKTSPGTLCARGWRRAPVGGPKDGLRASLGPGDLLARVATKSGEEPGCSMQAVRKLWLYRRILETVPRIARSFPFRLVSPQQQVFEEPHQRRKALIVPIASRIEL
jgi:hypothetical protein